MTKTKQNLMIKSLHNFWNSKFITSSLLCLSLSVSNTVLAEYKKPASTQNDAPAPNSTTISGTRGSGCSGREKTSLTALAPYSHIGKTIDPYPTFAWYIPDRQSYPVEFQLYEYNPSQFQGKGEMLVKAVLQSSPGIMTYSLPRSHAGLSPGKKYVWQVAVVCNPNHPSKSLVVSTQIMVVEMPSDLTNQLNSTGDVVARADIYAENGLWYDALAEVVTTKNNPQAKKFTAELLEQLAVEELEDNAHNLAEQENIILLRKKHQEQLEQVLNTFTTNYQ